MISRGRGLKPSSIASSSSEGRKIEGKIKGREDLLSTVGRERTYSLNLGNFKRKRAILRPSSRQQKKRK